MHYRLVVMGAWQERIDEVIVHAANLAVVIADARARASETARVSCVDIFRVYRSDEYGTWLGVVGQDGEFLPRGIRF